MIYWISIRALPWTRCLSKNTKGWWDKDLPSEKLHFQLEGKDPPEAAEVWEDSMHLVGTSSCQALPHILAPSCSQHPRRYILLVPAGARPAPMCLCFSKQNPVWQIRGAFSGRHRIARLEGEECGLTVRRGGLGPSSDAQRNVKVAGEALVWSNRGHFWDSVSNGAVFKLFIGQET